MAKDIWGNLIKTDIYGNKISKKSLKRQVIAENRRKGKEAEEGAKFSASLQGIDYVRTGRGHDYKAYKKDMLTGKKTFLGYREIKSSSTAPLSKLQKEKKKQMRGKYKVVRHFGGFW